MTQTTLPTAPPPVTTVAARPAAARPAAPPAPAPSPPASRNVGQNSAAGRNFTITRGIQQSAQIVCLYGAGGIGKSTLAALAPNPLVLDLDRGTNRLDVPRITDIETFDDLRAVLQNQSLFTGIDTVIVDTLTRAEELAVKHTLNTVPRNDQGAKAKSVEDYGYGKGYMHVYETFLTLVADLEAHKRAGRHVILIAHDCTCNVPNPQGEDWIRYEPMLQSPTSGKASIRLHVRNVVDHMLFIGYDVDVNREGKGRGSGTRTLYPTEQPHCMAKSRDLRDPMPLTEGDASVWAALMGVK